MQKVVQDGSTKRIPWWVSLVVIVGALLMAMGGVIALLHPGLLLAPDEKITEGVRVYAGYLVSRNLALAAMLLAMLFLRARKSLGVLALLTALIQSLDAGMDGWEGRWSLVPGVVVFAGTYFLIAIWLARNAAEKNGTIPERPGE